VDVVTLDVTVIDRERRRLNIEIARDAKRIDRHVRFAVR
jgi:hypothetical protein